MHQSVDSAAGMKCDVQKVDVDIDKAVPRALAAVELVANAVKHAFPDGGSGHIGVRLLHDNGQAHLVVDDDGVGLPEGLHAGTPDYVSCELSLPRSTARLR